MEIIHVVIEILNHPSIWTSITIRIFTFKPEFDLSSQRNCIVTGKTKPEILQH